MLDDPQKAVYIEDDDLRRKFLRLSNQTQFEILFIADNQMKLHDGQLWLDMRYSNVLEPNTSRSHRSDFVTYPPEEAEKRKQEILVAFHPIFRDEIIKYFAELDNPKNET